MKNSTSSGCFSVLIVVFFIGIFFANTIMNISLFPLVMLGFIILGAVGSVASSTKKSSQKPMPPPFEPMRPQQPPFEPGRPQVPPLHRPVNTPFDSQGHPVNFPDRENPSRPSYDPRLNAPDCTHDLPQSEYSVTSRNGRELDPWEIPDKKPPWEL